MEYSKNPPIRKPVLFLIKGCYFRKQPEMFLNLTLFDMGFF